MKGYAEGQPESWTLVQKSQNRVTLQARILCFLADSKMRTALWQYNDFAAAPAGPSWALCSDHVQVVRCRGNHANILRSTSQGGDVETTIVPILEHCLEPFWPHLAKHTPHTARLRDTKQKQDARYGSGNPLPMDEVFGSAVTSVELGMNVYGRAVRTSWVLHDLDELPMWQFNMTYEVARQTPQYAANDSHERVSYPQSAQGHEVHEQFGGAARAVLLGLSDLTWNVFMPQSLLHTRNPNSVESHAPALLVVFSVSDDYDEKLKHMSKLAVLLPLMRCFALCIPETCLRATTVQTTLDSLRLHLCAVWRDFQIGEFKYVLWLNRKDVESHLLVL